jgi:hypothetical protein
LAVPLVLLRVKVASAAVVKRKRQLPCNGHSAPCGVPNLVQVYQGRGTPTAGEWMTNPAPTQKKTLYRLYIRTVDVDFLLLALILWCGQIFGQLMSYIDASHQPETMIFHHRFGALCCNSMTQYDEPISGINFEIDVQ